MTPSVEVLLASSRFLEVAAESKVANLKQASEGGERGGDSGGAMKAVMALVVVVDHNDSSGSGSSSGRRSQ